MSPRAVHEGPPDLPGLVHERLLGSGGYSDVHLYRQQLPLRHVAVKVLKDSGLKEGLRSQLTAEANAMAGLSDHPNIVPVISASVSGDGRPYIVMTYYSRPNLAIRAASERLGVAEVLRLGIQIGSAVETAHRVGILHRDIKPANVLISQYGVPGLTDFGIAGTIADSDADDAEVGVSIPWAPPEVLYATGPTSVRSDVYSLAATLWHLLVGRSPFEVRGGDNSAFELMRRIRDTPPPSTGRADVPDSLDRLLRQSMAKDPGGRPRSALDLARGLQSIEQELHLARTEIVVLTERRPEVDLPQAPPTVARPMSYRSQPAGPDTARGPDGPPTPSGPGTPPAFDAPPDSRPRTPADSRSGPVWMPGAGAPDVRDSGARAPQGGARPGAAGPHSGDTPDGRSHGRLVGLAIAGLLAVAAVVTAFTVAGGGSDDHPKPTPTVGDTPGTQDAGQPGETIPVGKVTVSGKRQGRDELVFTWTYSGALASDTYQVRDSLTHRVRTVDSARIAFRSSRRLCVAVRVVRADGSDASLTFSTEGCAT